MSTITISKNKLINLINEAITSATAFHSSNADFEGFDLAYVNTGTKHQDYGYGIYLCYTDFKINAYGNIKYTVEIPSKKSLYLEADKEISTPLKNKTIKLLYNTILKNDEDGSYGDIYAKRELMQDIVSSFEYIDGLSLYGTLSYYLGSDKNASEFIYNKLNKIGLKYNLNSNFPCVVMYNPKDIRIIKKEKI